MPVKYKFDVLLALKEAGYNTTKLRKEKLLAEGVIQSLRDGKAISFQNLGRICDLLNCQPGDILEYEQEAWGITPPFCPVLLVEIERMKKRGHTLTLAK